MAKVIVTTMKSYLFRSYLDNSVYFHTEYSFN